MTSNTSGAYVNTQNSNQGSSVANNTRINVPQSINGNLNAAFQSSLIGGISGMSSNPYSYSTNGWNEVNKKVVELFLRDGSKIIRRLDFSDIENLQEREESGDVHTVITFRDSSRIEVECSANAIMNVLGVKYERFAEFSIKNILNGGE